jgi:hypothetical protein
VRAASLTALPYPDHGSATPVAPEVFEAMRHSLNGRFANPCSEGTPRNSLRLS